MLSLGLVQTGSQLAAGNAQAPLPTLPNAYCHPTSVLLLPATYLPLCIICSYVSTIGNAARNSLRSFLSSLVHKCRGAHLAASGPHLYFCPVKLRVGTEVCSSDNRSADCQLHQTATKGERDRAVHSKN